MKSIFMVVFCSILFQLAQCQESPFEFGSVSLPQLLMTRYDKDTTASAVFLREFGDVRTDEMAPHFVVFHYHSLLKILRPEGLSYANFHIELYGGKFGDELLSLKAATYNLENSQISITEFDPKNILTQQVNEYHVSKRIPFPNLRVGSVLELDYTVKSPPFIEFWRWEFQSEVPKVNSEYWATLPSNYVYNLTLVGFLQLSKSDVSVVSGCWEDADCNLYKFAMDNVPAFVKEEYMTSPANYISAVEFELSEYKYPGGGTRKFTQTWNDAENILMHDNYFGVQIKKGRDILTELSPAAESVPDSLNKARLIFDFIKNHYQWNEDETIFSWNGIKKAFETNSGSVGDINLSLIAALRAAGLNVVPVILSTRDNGVPYEKSPMLSDYNYVIALLHVRGHDYLLDATDRDLPFGMIPERCLNGKGRALSDGHSYWYPLDPSAPSREYCGMDVAFDEDGDLVGTVTRRFTGYSAYQRRKQLDSCSGEGEYIKTLERKFPKSTITNYSVSHRDSLDQPLVETFQISMNESDDMSAAVVPINPFLTGKLKENPFKLNSRQYPVDFGTTSEQTFSVSIQLPKGYEIDDLPGPVRLALPNNAGHYACSIQVIGNTLRLSYLLSISKPVFAPIEYDELKEFYSRIVQSEGTDVVLKASGK